MESRRFYLPALVMQKLKALAGKRGVAIGEVVRQALREYVEKNES